jgi:hypothetical protein
MGLLEELLLSYPYIFSTTYKSKYNHTYESLYQFFWGTKYNTGDFTFHLDKFQDFDVTLSELDSFFLHILNYVSSFVKQIPFWMARDKFH